MKMEKNDRVIKCVAIGDGYVGKTCLLTRLSNKEYDTNTGYVPTIFDNTSIEVTVNDQKYDLHLFDTAGQENFASIRKMAYENTDVFLLCFSVENMTSFLNIQHNWLSELNELYENPTVILVGTKADLRNDPDTMDRMHISNEVYVSKDAAETFAKKVNAKYIECSSHTLQNINELKYAIVEVHTEKQSKGYLYSICNSSPFIFIRKILFCKFYNNDNKSFPGS